jgi:HSP20 family protein
MGWRPAAHVQGIRVEDFVKDNEYVVRAELPGLDRTKTRRSRCTAGVLTIRAKRREKSESNRSEFRYGSFSHSARLPEGADEEKVTAG